MEILGAIGLLVTLLGVAARLVLIEVDKRIEREVHKRVSVATFSELVTEFREFKDEVNRSGVLDVRRRR